jgi:hypothetical protein
MACFQFAHVLLPRLAFGDPAALCRGLASGSDILEKLWLSAHAGALTPPRPLRVTRQMPMRGGETFLVELPAPDAGPHALAIVFQDALDGAAETSVRYFTLELGSIRPGDSSPWFLCEWEPDRGHANWGALPSPDPELFLQRVQALLYTSAA